MYTGRLVHAADSASLIAALLARAREHSVVWQGVRVRWRCWGAGAPLLLLHGGHGSWLHWVRNIDALAKHFAVWVPDMPGYGDSDALPGGSDFSDFLSAMTACLDQLFGQAQPIYLIGFSFGGLVAAKLASQRANVARLALLGPGGHGGLRRQTLPMMNWRSATTPAEREMALRNNLASLMLHHEESITPLAVEIQDRCNQASRFHSKSISRSATLQQALQQAQVATLLLWGEHDVTADPAAVAPGLQALHPGNQCCTIPDAGHWVQYERADATQQVLLDWFSVPP